MVLLRVVNLKQGDIFYKNLTGLRNAMQLQHRFAIAIDDGSGKNGLKK